MTQKPKYLKPQSRRRRRRRRRRKRREEDEDEGEGEQDKDEGEEEEKKTPLMSLKKFYGRNEFWKKMEKGRR